ncbi:MAG: AAC(3) family N-acetyltransferase [Pseudomonadota bacterium]
MLQENKNGTIVSRWAEDLVSLGVEEGDTILVRAALRKLGPTEQNRATALLQAFELVLGENGALLALCFSETYRRPSRKPQACFIKESHSSSGGLANAMLSYPGCYRSRHPTNSWIGLGNPAKKILQYHDEKSPCFSPIKDLIDNQGKMILIGCAKESPGFSTVHWAQFNLGLSYRNLLSNKTGIYYLDSYGNKKLFLQKDMPGCSRGFKHFYGDYAENEILNTGYVGDAYCLLADAGRAYQIEHDILKNNPRYALCDDPLCKHCNLLVTYNKRKFIPFLIKKTIKKIKQGT